MPQPEAITKRLSKITAKQSIMINLRDSTGILKKSLMGMFLFVLTFGTVTGQNNFYDRLADSVPVLTEQKVYYDTSYIETDESVISDKHQFYAGFGAGPETGISLFVPKISYYNFQNRKSLSMYYGIEVSFWMIEVPMISLDCLYGIKKSIFTFDTSAGMWWLPNHTMYIDDYEKFGGSCFHTTLNPKIGIKFWKVWLKAGPSFHLYKKYPEESERTLIVDLVKIGKMYYNFEILIKL